MGIITTEFLPPFAAVEGCAGHIFDYASFWQVEDSLGRIPWAAIKDNSPDTIMDKEWCERKAAELNANANG